jgi:hypothetical protein
MSPVRDVCESVCARSCAKQEEVYICTRDMSIHMQRYIQDDTLAPQMFNQDVPRIGNFGAPVNGSSRESASEAGSVFYRCCRMCST